MKKRLAMKILSEKNFRLYTIESGEEGKWIPFMRCRRYSSMIANACTRLGEKNILEEIDEHNKGIKYSEDGNLLLVNEDTGEFKVVKPEDEGYEELKAEADKQ